MLLKGINLHTIFMCAGFLFHLSKEAHIKNVFKFDALRTCFKNDLFRYQQQFL